MTSVDYVYLQNWLLYDAYKCSCKLDPYNLHTYFNSCFYSLCFLILHFCSVHSTVIFFNNLTERNLFFFEVVSLICMFCCLFPFTHYWNISCIELTIPVALPCMCCGTTGFTSFFLLIFLSPIPRLWFPRFNGSILYSSMMLAKILAFDLCFRFLL